MTPTVAEDFPGSQLVQAVAPYWASIVLQSNNLSFQRCLFCTVVSNATSRLKESRARSRAPSTGQGVVKVNAGARPVMGRARFSLGWQAPARCKRTLIPSTSLRRTPRAETLPLVECLFKAVCVCLSPQDVRTHPPTPRRHSCPRTRSITFSDRGGSREEMGAKFLRGVRMGLLAARGTCKLSVVAHPHLN